MPRYRIEFTCSWSPEKVRAISQRVRQDIGMYGGMSDISGIIPMDQETPPEDKPKTLKLYCTSNQFGKGRCTARWESPVFTECPNGHGRRWVHKEEEAKVAS